MTAIGRARVFAAFVRVARPTRKGTPRINEVVNEVITLLQRELFQHRVALRLELASGLPSVIADRVQLQQVIINLVMNGMEAMQPVADRQRNW